MPHNLIQTPREVKWTAISAIIVMAALFIPRVMLVFDMPLQDGRVYGSLVFFQPAMWTRPRGLRSVKNTTG
jgi:hypothetical protein